jgi:Fe-S cluster assembly iron-binding protein IscA
MIITPTASDKMKYELQKAKDKGRVAEGVDIVMRVQILQDEEGKRVLGVGIDLAEFIHDDDDIIALNDIRVVIDKESGKLLEESTLDYYCRDDYKGWGVDKLTEEKSS